MNLDDKSLIVNSLAAIPAHVIVWKTASGKQYTAEQMRNLIAQDDPDGVQWIHDVVQISIELLGRSCKK